MKGCWIHLLLLLTMANRAHANVAVDELNALLAKKMLTKHSRLNVTTRSGMIKNLAENYYFVFIYKGSCPHCHHFAPVLKDFTDTFHINVKSYSLDDAPLDAFKGPPLTPELFQTFFVAGGYKPAVPALFLVNRHTQDAFAVLFGEAQDYELANRVHELMQHIEEKYND